MESNGTACRLRRVWLIALLAGPVSVAADVRDECHAYADPQSRLACYDRITGRTAARPDAAEAAPAVSEAARESTDAESAPTDAASATTDAASAPADASSAPTDAASAIPGPPPARSAGGEAPKYHDVEDVAIAGIEPFGLGRHRFRLDNGQVWEQLEAHAITLQQHDRVNIRQTLFGAWRMRDLDSQSRSVKVRRIE